MWNFSERYSPYALKDWAKEKNAAIEYVDSCWLRVEVGGKDLREFLTDLGREATPHVASALPRIEDGARYIIVAEEF